MEFDQKGVVKEYTTFPDSHLSREMPYVAAACSTMALEGRELRVSYWRSSTEPLPAVIVLENGQFRFREVQISKKAVAFAIPARDVIGISTSRLEKPSPDYRLRFFTFAVIFAEPEDLEAEL